MRDAICEGTITGAASVCSGSLLHFRHLPKCRLSLKATTSTQMKKLAVLALFLACTWVNATPVHHCAAHALKQAEKLLPFHFGPDERIAIDKSVKVMSPIRNPANKAQSFDVLEVWGSVYKGQYKMHFIYAQLGGDCVLMGQEILEHASL